MTFKATGTAGGKRFFLQGRTAIPSTAIVNKFETAIETARKKIADAIVVISQNPPNLDARQKVVLEYCFNPDFTNAGQMLNTFATIKRVLETTLRGLQTDDLNLYEAEPATLAKLGGGAEGYVWIYAYGLIQGEIHTRFDLDAGRTLNNIIHEATHKFVQTLDRKYLASHLPGFVSLKTDPTYLAMGAAATAPAPVCNADGLVNADSYSAFAVNLT
jgi:hypothetical protein